MKHMYFLFILLIFFSLELEGQIIITIAGNNAAGYSGDNGPATNAQLNEPRGIALDAIGNIYISDGNNHVIRKINLAGTITTFAGTNIAGFSGDGGSATDAKLNQPGGLAFDKFGNLYISDVFNYRIRKINTSGVISTIAGNGTSGYSGDGGSAILAEFTAPGALATDTAGNIYVTDIGNNRIRKISVTDTITTVAGNGIAGYSGDGGIATSAKLFSPNGIAVDSSGYIYISDGGNSRIRYINASGIITTFAGSSFGGFSGDGGPAIAAELKGPLGISVIKGNMVIADQANRRIRKIDNLNIISTIAGDGTLGYYGDGGPATAAELNNPSSVVSDAAGNVYIADQFNHVIRKIVSSVAGIENLVSVLNYQIYPNPTNCDVNIIAYDDLKYYIFDFTGTTIQKGLLRVGKNDISIKSFASGTYILELAHNNGEKGFTTITKE